MYYYFLHVLTEALSSTLRSFLVVIPPSSKAFSKVNRGRLSHFPKTTKSISLKKYNISTNTCTFETWKIQYTIIPRLRN